MWMNEKRKRPIEPSTIQEASLSVCEAENFFLNKAALILREESLMCILPRVLSSQINEAKATLEGCEASNFPVLKPPCICFQSTTNFRR
jgi:hypothetical protein